MSGNVRPLHVSNRWNFWNCSYLRQRQCRWPAPKDVLQKRSDSTSSTFNEPPVTLRHLRWTPVGSTSSTNMTFGQETNCLGYPKPMAGARLGQQFCDYDLTIFAHQVRQSATSSLPITANQFGNPLENAHHGFLL